MFDALLYLVATIAHAQIPTTLPANLDPNSSDCFYIFHDGGFQRPDNTPVPPGTGFTCVELYIQNLTFVVISFAATLSLIMLIVNGIRYMVGPAVPGGSSDAAKKGIAAALTGLVVSLLTYIIIDTVIGAVTN